MTDGNVGADERLLVISEMGEGGIVFGDGIESDQLDFGWGRELVIAVAPKCLNLVAA